MMELLDLWADYADLMTPASVAPRPVLVVERDGLKELLAWSCFNEEDKDHGYSGAGDMEYDGFLTDGRYLVFINSRGENQKKIDWIWRRVICRPGLTKS